MAKQRFLVKEIIEQGFNQDQFTLFLQTWKASDQIDNALNIDQWTFDELDEAVKVFQEHNQNPYMEHEPERFYVNKVDDSNWEDLEYAEENADFGRETYKKNSIAGEAHVTKQAKRFNDPKDYMPIEEAYYEGYNTSRIMENAGTDPLNDTLSNMFVL